MIGRKAEGVLNRAVRYAAEHDHEFFTLEHVLWSLLADQTIFDIIVACGGNPSQMRAELASYLSTEIPKISAEDLRALREGQEGPEGKPVDHPIATLSIQRLIQRAIFHVQSAGKDEIQPEDLFIALFQAKNSMALHLLGAQGIERLDVLNYVSHGIRKEREGSDSDSSVGGDEDRPARGATKLSGEDPLNLFASNLNERAQRGQVDPLVGRYNEMERIIQVLCRRRKNNPLLVGEAGVGKTALAEGIAQRIVEGDIPSPLRNAVIYALDMGALLAGAKFRGDFEQRLKRLIQSMEAKQEAGQQPVLFIDEIHTIVGAGAVSGGALDAANLLKPLLTRGTIRCMGSTTYAEYRTIFEKDHALARRFQNIDIVEPSIDEAVQILNGIKSKFEDHHQIFYTPEAIRAAVELSSRHLSDRFLPDKAIDVIDEAGARARLRREKEPDNSAPLLGVEMIEETISQIARIPARSVNTGQKNRLKSLKADLKLTIFGQDAAVEALVTAIRLARSGLRTGDKPVGSFLFCGPTGVGKTELSKQLAHCLGVPFLRFDMSEYNEKHTVSRLIGAPPGYVGFDQAGLLTEGVIKNPYSVVLLDEVEKAHPDIWNILLQVMDHGTLTDSSGRKADFKNAVLIMTSNVGSREMERRPLGMTDTAHGLSLSSAHRAIEQTFSPEFRNRLDSVVYFNRLDPQTVSQVVGKQLMELESQLLAKNVDIELDPLVREWLTLKGYDRLMGARPLSRLIQEQIKRPLSEEILFGRLEKGGKVVVTLRDDQLEFTIAEPVRLSEEALELTTVVNEN